MAYARRYAGGFVDKPSQTTPMDSTFLNAVEAALLKLYALDPSDEQIMAWVNANSRFEPTLIKNAHIDPAAAIAKSKLAALSITDADVAGAAAIAQSKLALAITNAQIDPAAAIVPSKISGGVGMQLICDSLLSGSQATFDTNAILGGNIPQAFKHLMVVVNARMDVAGPGLALRANGVSTNSYNFSYFDETGTATSAPSGLTGQSMAICGVVSGSTDAGGRFASTEIFIPDYANPSTVNSTRQFLWRSGGWQQGTYRSEAGSCEYDNVGALTRLAILGWTGLGNFVAGSRFSLYGVN